jgi:hypothetical protein
MRVSIQASRARLNHKAALAALFVSVAWVTSAHAAVVAPDSNYFAGWKAATFDDPGVALTKTAPVAATLDGVSFTISWLGDVGGGAHQWQRWGGVNANLMSSAASRPANIGLPLPAGGNTWEIGGGQYSLKFATPMPYGTTLISHDIDATDAAQYSFWRCNGTQVDAVNVEFIQISTSSIPIQTQTSAYWQLESPANTNTSGIVSGLMVKANDVCVILVSELGRTSHSTIDYMLALPPPAAIQSPMPVPVDHPLGLLALTGLMTWAARRVVKR